MVGHLRGLALALAAGLAMLAPPAWAGLKATYVADLPKDMPKALNDMRMIIYVDDAGHERIDIVANGTPTGSLISRDGDTYMIQRGADGAVTVSRQTDVMLVSREQFLKVAERFKLRSSDKGPPMIYKLVDLGPATVAGRTGTRYGLTRTSPPRETNPIFQYVISTDPALAPLGRIMLRQLTVSAGVMDGVLPQGTNMVTLVAEILAKGAVLQMPGLIHLDTVETIDLDPKLFELPGPVETLDQVRARMKPLEMLPSDEAMDDMPSGKAPPAKAPSPAKP